MHSVYGKSADSANNPVDSDEIDDSGETVESSDLGKYDKSCYRSEYGY